MYIIKDMSMSGASSRITMLNFHVVQAGFICMRDFAWCASMQLFVSSFQYCLVSVLRDFPFDERQRGA